MAMHEVNFPASLNYGSSGGPGHSTNIIEVDSGQEERVVRWSGARRRYNAAYQVKDRDSLGELMDFYLARSGPAYGFRFKDWSDYTTAANHRDAPAATDVEIEVGDGATVIFQLLKFYTSGPTTITRHLHKPVANTVVVALDGVVKTEGVHYSVNTVTGEITFNTAPGVGVSITAGCEFDVPVRFADEMDEQIEIEIEESGWGSIPTVTLVEILGGTMVDDCYNYGGSRRINPMNVDVTWAPGNGRLQVLVPNSSARNFYMPTFSVVTWNGAVICRVINRSPSASVTLRYHPDDGGAAFGTVAAGTAATIDKHQSTWYAHP